MDNKRRYSTEKKQIIIGVVTAVFFLFTAVSMGETLSPGRFISPDTCGDCHSEIHSQWQNSMHNLAHYDPIYVAVSEYLLGGLTDPDEIAESESCVKCHTPVGNITGYPLKTSDDRKKVSAMAAQAIQCDYCHSATGARKMENNGLILSPGQGEDDPGIKRGPYTDSESDFHATAFSKFHTSSDICGTCHNVSHVSFGTKLETTYDEWKKGPYNSTDPSKHITCQGCHMMQRPGIPATASTQRPPNKGRAADDGPMRDHVFTHVFVGANTVVPSGFGGKDKADMALERLQNSATLGLDTEKIKDGQLGISITNSGAGHYLPTGLTDVRQMWLDIRIIDEKNTTVFSRGALDKDGYVPDDAILYHTVFGDGKGHPVLNIAKAREVLKDKRIPPGQSVRENIEFPKNKAKQLTIIVKLLYRSAPQKVLDQVLGKGKQTLPIVTMEEIQTTLTL
ncbi:MAG: cytochrome c family protein [Proteobacteria bacterium]|nr:cytochrome c family protein [Pseudomonadota bacterium]